MELTDWLDGMDMPRLVVFTKGDKVPRGRAKGQYEKFVASGMASVLPPFVTNGKNDENAERLRQAIAQVINELSRIQEAGFYGSRSSECWGHGEGL
jgi:GTP-binding protein